MTLAPQERPHREVGAVVLWERMDRSLEVAHRLLELLGFIGKAGEGEVRGQLRLASFVV